MSLSFQAIPILRIGSVAEAKEFYCEHLGFAVDWEHYFEPGAPVYMQNSRAGMSLQLSENERFKFGTSTYVKTVGIREFHAQLLANSSNFPTPSVTVSPWNTEQLEFEDPYGNLLRFHEELVQ